MFCILADRIVIVTQHYRLLAPYCPSVVQFCYGIRSREIIFEVVELTYMTTDHQRHRQTGRQMDGRTTCRDN